MTVLTALIPEIILIVCACVLFLLGTSAKPLSRRIAAEIALVAVTSVFLIQCYRVAAGHTFTDAGAAIRVQPFSDYVKLITGGVGVLLVLLNLPTNKLFTGGTALDTGTDTAEFFGLLLLSLAGLCTVASANDLILLFLGIELASIPTYIMVSISRPLPIAQEAGLKYFFLGAMSAAVMLFGFSYLYGTTGTASLDGITTFFSQRYAEKGLDWSDWHLLAVIFLIVGFAFKMAAFPLHSYAGDVYQGAATPVTAFLSFVPKTSGFVALIKILFAVGGGTWMLPAVVINLLVAMAGITMTLGNVMGLLQHNIKRMLAYSSVAHTGYMLVGIAAVAASSRVAGIDRTAAIAGVLFYLAIYGIGNVAAFGVLQLLPSRTNRPATSAETFDDIAGQGLKHVGLGLAMSVACLSLAGVPLTAGFIGKLYLAIPAAKANLIGLSLVLWLNAAISAAYYLKVVVALFLRSQPANFSPDAAVPTRFIHPTPVVVAVMLSVIATILFGAYPRAIRLLSNRAAEASVLEATTPTRPTVAVASR